MRFSSFTNLVGQGLHNLKANKMMTLASMGVLIVCMILVGAAFLFGANIDSMVAYIGEQNETVAFINDDADTAAVEEAIRRVHEAMPDVLLCAGTVLTTEQVDRAVNAGAAAIVSPGLSPDVVKYCVEKNIPVCPGTANPSDVQIAIQFGLKAV